LFKWVLVPLGGIMLALLKRKKSDWVWTSPILYGLAGSAFIAMIMFALMGRPMLSRQKPQTTPENIESNVKMWADNFSLGIQKQTDDKFSFLYAIALPSGRAVLVGRPVQRDRYLQFQGIMPISPEHEAILEKLSPPQLERFTDEVNIEMARSKMGFLLVGGPIKGVIVTKAIPITNSLTEDSFVAYLDEIDSSMMLAREAIRLALLRTDDATSKPTPRPATSQ